MSYIKSAVVFDGIARIVEVYGPMWSYLDIQAYGRGMARHYRQLEVEAKKRGENLRYEQTARDFDRIEANPLTIRGGLARDILDRGLSPVTDDNKREWMLFALEEDMPGWAPLSQRDRPPAVVVDFDINTLTDSPKNNYAEYQLTLPDAWKYARSTPEQIVERIRPALPESDLPRLGSLERGSTGRKR